MNKIIVALGSALGLLMFTAPSAQASTPSARTVMQTWTVMPTPASIGPQQGVSCWAARGCLSVGGGQAMSWSRHTWMAVPAPANSVVAAVSCLSPAYCIGVGSVNREGAAAWSWNGRSWTVESAYSPGTEGAGLLAVSCASATSCEAVGSSDATGAGGPQAPFAEKWNGRTWTNQPISGAPAGGWLDGVACESAGRCEAVGNSPAYPCTSGVCVIPPVAWAAGLSGSGWVAQPSLASLYPEASGAFSVSCWSSGCTAVGREGSAVGPDNPGYTFAARWNGSTWSQQGAIGSGAPSGSYLAYWSGVQCASVSRCTAVGSYESNYGGPTVTLASTWNGSTWSQAAAPGSPGSFLAGLSCTHHSFICTAVGSQGSAVLALREHRERAIPRRS
jgi:hypothetical protein